MHRANVPSSSDKKATRAANEFTHVLSRAKQFQNMAPDIRQELIRFSQEVFKICTLSPQREEEEKEENVMTLPRDPIIVCCSCFIFSYYTLKPQTPVLFPIDITNLFFTNSSKKQQDLVVNVEMQKKFKDRVNKLIEKFQLKILYHKQIKDRRFNNVSPAIDYKYILCGIIKESLQNWQSQSINCELALATFDKGISDTLKPPHIVVIHILDILFIHKKSPTFIPEKFIEKGRKALEEYMNLYQLDVKSVRYQDGFSILLKTFEQFVIEITTKKNYFKDENINNKEDTCPKKNTAGSVNNNSVEARDPTNINV